MKKTNRKIRLGISLLLLCAFCKIGSGEIIYVDVNATGANDGSSWTDAYNYLQDALHDPSLTYGDEIWVAQGTYKPDEGGGQTLGYREATFQLVNGVGLYGGFPDSGSPVWEDRDPNLYETILTGDIGTTYDPNDNSYHVVRCSYTDSNTILDGFIITAGNSYGGWSKIYGGSEDDRAYSGQQTSDGGYILAGFTYSFGAGVADCWLVKTDPNGNEEWNKTFGGYHYDYAESVQQTSDGGYILSGRTKSFGAGNYDLWLIKTDSNGNEEWNKTFGGPEDDQAESVQQTSDGGYIVAGYTESFGAGYRDVWLIKTDPNGNEEWNKTFGSSVGDGAKSVQQTSDGGYIVAGYTEFSAPYTYFWLIKTNPDGNEEWNKTFGSYYEYAFSVQQTFDGGYIVAGKKSYFGDPDEAWLVKTDSNGIEEWNKTVGSPGPYATSVQQTSDGGYVVGTVGGSLIKTDPNGEEEWVKNLGLYCYSAQQTSDGSYITAGYGYSFATDFDICLKKYNHIHAIGGGMYNYHSHSKVMNCTLNGNTANNSGGGIYNFFSGLTISECTFNDNSADENGAGIYNLYSDGLVINNCTFSSNVATSAFGDGGGMYNRYSSLTVTNCTFSGNEAATYGGDGGGMVNYWSDSIIANCIFVNNNAERGGGMYNYNSDPNMTKCDFVENIAEDWGGGCYCDYLYSDVQATSCKFIKNSARVGGGMAVSGGVLNDCVFSNNSAEFGGAMNLNGSLILNNCLFNENIATDSGGAISNSSYSSPILTACIFKSNSANSRGGGFHNTGQYSSNPILTSCIFSGNSAGVGGGVMFDSYGSPTVTNCTFTGNYAKEDGGGMCCWNMGGSLTNCIFWSNFDVNGVDEEAQLHLRTSWGIVEDTVNYSCIQGLDSFAGNGNIGVDPCFINPGQWVDINDPNIIVEPNDSNAVWLDGDYHLKSFGWRWDNEREFWDYDDVTSRCIDAGNPGSPLADELMSFPDDPCNIWGENIRINMGAYGGTNEASMPPYDWALLSDVNNDGIVNLTDFAEIGQEWLTSGDSLPCDFDRDGAIGLDDVMLMTQDWLNQTSWH